MELVPCGTVAKSRYPDRPTCEDHERAMTSNGPDTWSCPVARKERYLRNRERDIAQATEWNRKNAERFNAQRRAAYRRSGE